MPYKNNKNDYEPINSNINIKTEIEELENYTNKKIDNDIYTQPDDFSTMISKMFKSMNIVTGLFIFMLYILINTDCFQLHIIREIYPTAYDPKTDTITDNGIIFNGVLLSLFYIIFDISYNNEKK